jgi:hypothetical protein
MINSIFDWPEFSNSAQAKAKTTRLQSRTGKYMEVLKRDERRESRVKGRAASDFSVSLWLCERRFSGVLTEALGHGGLAV